MVQGPCASAVEKLSASVEQGPWLYKDLGDTRAMRLKACEASNVGILDFTEQKPSTRMFQYCCDGEQRGQKKNGQSAMTAREGVCCISAVVVNMAIQANTKNTAFY